MRRRCHLQEGFLRHLLEMPEMQGKVDGSGHLRPPQQLIGLLDLADLLPCGCHEGFLVTADHFGPESGGCSMAGIEVEFV